MEVDEFQCLNTDNIITPIDANRLESLLIESEYDCCKTEHLIKGFRTGFSLGYEGPSRRQDKSENLPFTIGSPTEMWNKIMKEVKLNRYAGPFTTIPHDFYIQSPIGLVPKDGGKKTRLIFHLSYDFKTSQVAPPNSVNFFTPDNLCSVKYKDLDYAVKSCLQLKQELNDGFWDPILKKENLSRNQVELTFSKTDAVSAFRILLISPGQRRWLIMKAKHPKTGETSACHSEQVSVALSFNFFLML